MGWWRRDPGPCIVCEAPHTSCTADTHAPGAVREVSTRDQGTAHLPKTPPASASTTAPPLSTQRRPRRRK